jgi:hypothetical protein
MHGTIPRVFQSILRNFDDRVPRGTTPGLRYPPIIEARPVPPNPASPRNAAPDEELNP